MHCIDDHPLKKYRLTSVYKDDMDWIRGEIIDIKMCIREVACRIEKLLERHEELSWTLARIIFYFYMIYHVYYTKLNYSYL